MQAPNSFRQKMWYSFGQFGNGVYNGLNNAIMGLFVSAFTGNPFIIGYLSNTRTIEGVVIQPIVGRWSDRSNGRMGRRRPFILFGIPLSVLFLTLTPLAGHAGSHWALPLIIVSIILFSITWNIAGDPYQALMIDITPEHERSIFNAVLSVIALVGQVAILLYASVASINKKNIPDPIFYLCAGFLLLTYAVVFFGVREPKQATEQAREQGKSRLDPLEVVDWEARFLDLLDEGDRLHPHALAPPGGRGRCKQSPARNLLDRLRKHQQAVLAFLEDLRVDFDNNLAERDLRMVKVQQKVSGCFRSVAGAEAFSCIRGYLSTLRKQGMPLLSALQATLGGHPVLPSLQQT